MAEQSDYRKYLIPSVIARLANLELKAKQVVEGFMAGLHKSPYHGFSVEFTEHRQYMPGDDLKNLDWKVFAKTKRYYVKQFEEETNLKSFILLDVSKSMTFNSKTNDRKDTNSTGRIFDKFRKKKKTGVENPINGKISKLEYASYLAASLAYLMVLQRDAVSLTTYDTGIRKYIPPHSTKTNLKLILKELSGVKAQYETGTAVSLNEIAERIKKRGLVIVISDFFDKQNEVINALKHFRYNKNEVIIFQILDPVELSFLEGNPMTIVDMETREELYSQPFAVQKSYKEAMKEFIGTYKSECRKNNIDYVLLTTDTPFDISLLKYLNKRSRII